CLLNIVFSFPELKNWNYKLAGVVCSFIAWFLGIVLANSRFWRVWEFESNTVHFVYIGFWEAYYNLKVNISGSVFEWTVHTTISMSWTVPPDLHYGKDLLLLANFMKLVVLIFSKEAYFISWVNGPYPNFRRFCYNMSIFFLVLSSACTMGAVIWNYAVDFYGQTTLDFPGTFPVTKEALIKKHLSHVFPLGMLTATFSLISAVMFMSEIYAMKQGNRVKPVVLAKYVSQKD
ncbi:uncharacterized protein, partial [Castor canadensis]|uniref:Uncharacterized protein n=1 Tax=Castor canadensis TaxID=51338 RepID=A0A8B7TQE0_CASCN